MTYKSLPKDTKDRSWSLLSKESDLYPKNNNLDMNKGDDIDPTIL